MAKMTKEELEEKKKAAQKDNSDASIKDAAEAKQGEYTLSTDASGNMIVKKKEQGTGIPEKKPKLSLHDKEVYSAKYRVNMNTKSKLPKGKKK